MLIKLNNQEKSINYKRLNFMRDKHLEFGSRGYSSLKELFKEIGYRKLSIGRVEDTKGICWCVYCIRKIQVNKI